MVLSCLLYKLFTMQVKAIELLFNRTSNDYDSIVVCLPSSTGSFKIISSKGLSSRMERPLDSSLPVTEALSHHGEFEFSKQCMDKDEARCICGQCPVRPARLTYCSRSSGNPTWITVWTSSNLGISPHHVNQNVETARCLGVFLFQIT